MSAQKSHSAIVTNRRILRDYMVEDKYEAGLELRGTEVKSLRAGMVSLVGAYASIERGEAWLHGMTVQPYEFGNRFNHEMERARKLLLHKAEMQVDCGWRSILRLTRKAVRLFRQNG